MIFVWPLAVRGFSGQRNVSHIASVSHIETNFTFFWFQASEPGFRNTKITTRIANPKPPSSLVMHRVRTLKQTLHVFWFQTSEPGVRNTEITTRIANPDQIPLSYCSGLRTLKQTLHVFGSKLRTRASEIRRSRPELRTQTQCESGFEGTPDFWKI